MTQAHHAAAQADAKTLDEVRARRASLRKAMSAVAEAAEAPLGGHMTDWAAQLVGDLSRLSGAWERHITITEADGGLFGQIRGDAPELDPQLQQLHKEHDKIRDQIGRLCSAITAAGGDEAMLQQLREQVTIVLSDLIRHRQRGADLVYRAYEVDLGGGG
jgi:hypothetical protein